jgi:hypothetical protein
MSCLRFKFHMLNSSGSLFMAVRTKIKIFSPGHNVVILRFVEKLPWSPIWSTDQSSWLQIQRFGFDSRRCQIFWEVMGLERGPLSLVSAIEEVLGRKSSDSGLESREYGRRDPSRWPRGGRYSQKLALTSPTSGGRSVGIVRLRTQATEFRRYISYSSPKL